MPKGLIGSSFPDLPSVTSVSSVSFWLGCFLFPWQESYGSGFSKIWDLQHNLVFTVASSCKDLSVPPRRDLPCHMSSLSLTTGLWRQKRWLMLPSPAACLLWNLAHSLSYFCIHLDLLLLGTQNSTWLFLLQIAGLVVCVCVGGWFLPWGHHSLYSIPF